MAGSLASTQGQLPFAQQGSVDWVQLANATISVPVAILSRLATGGVDHFTVVVGLQLSSRFILSTQGMSRLTDALEKLPSCSSMGNFVWFGFGVKHIIRDLARTTHGLECLALCGCLAELHSPDTAALVLIELGAAFGAPDELRPSAIQWKTLVELCSGILRPTTFACVADQFMRFSPQYGSNAGEYEDVAKALVAISRVSTGSLMSITLCGSAACGWIAAFGHWFLGLEVEISTSDGELLFKSTAHDQRVQIYVVYETEGNSGVTVENSTYWIRCVDDIVVNYEDRYQLILTGQVSWEKCISMTFGTSGHIMLDTVETVGFFIGNAARIFEGVTNAEPAGFTEDIYHTDWDGYNYGQYGEGFLDSAILWFPELFRMRDSMGLGTNMTFRDAWFSYQDTAETLTEMCRCINCDGSSRDNRYCLPVLAETIIFLVWNLSSLCLDCPINPTRAGLLFIYKLHTGNSYIDTESLFGKRYSQNDAPLLGGPGELIRLLDTASVYHTAQFLFTSNLNPQVSVTSFTAASVWGICFYLDILREVSDRPERACRLHVIPGWIHDKNGRRHSYITDKTRMPLDGMFSLRWREDMGFEWTPTVSFDYKCMLPTQATFGLDDIRIDTGSPDIQVKLIVQESHQGLMVDFRSVSTSGMCQVGPYSLFRAIIEGSGRVNCSHRDCQMLKPPYEILGNLYDSQAIQKVVTVDGEGQLNESTLKDYEKVACIRRLSGNVLARCLGLLVDKGCHDLTILRRSECIFCCIRAAAEDSGRVAYIIE